VGLLDRTLALDGAGGRSAPRLDVAEARAQAAEEAGTLVLEGCGEVATLRLADEVGVPLTGDGQVGVGVGVHVHLTSGADGFFPARAGNLLSMSLRGQPVEAQALLADGRALRVRIGVPDDPYIRRRDLDTVAVELFDGERVLATVNSVLSAGQTSEARALADEIVAGLEGGELEPTAAAIERLAERIP
jgi:hypothetical protein